MNSAKIRLIAAREFTEGGRAKAYRIGTVLMALLVAAGVTLPHLVRDGASRTDIAVVGEFDAVTRRVAEQVGATSGMDLVFREVATRQDAVSDVQGGRVDIALVEGRELVIARALRPGDVSPRARLVSGLSVLLAIKDTGPLPVNGLSPPPATTGNAEDRLTGFAGVLIIFVFILYYGIWVLGGVTEEKTNRLAELLLASVRPVELMVGKVVGIGVLAFVQGAIVGTVALAAAYASGSDSVREVTGRMVGVVLLWFLLGYALYALAYAAAGATVARPEDARSAPGPLMIPLLVGYVAPITALTTGQDSTLLQALSFFPMTAPFGMTMRVGLGTATIAELALAVALMLVAIAAMGWAAARVYRNSILRTGKKTGLLEAFRLAR